MAAFSGGSLNSVDLAGLGVAEVDQVLGHQQPPAVADAVGSEAVDGRGAVRALVGHRFELGELLLLDVEAQRAVRRGHPDIAVEIGVDRAGGAGGRARRQIDHDFLVLGIDAAEAAMAARDVRAGVEPHHAVLVAGDAVGAGRDAALVVKLEMLHRAGLAVDLGDRGVGAGVAEGDPDVAVEIHLRVMHARHVMHFARACRATSRAVVGAVVAAFHREVVFLDDDARRFAGRPRPQLELHRAFARTARAGEIGGELLLMEFDIAGRLAVGARIDAEHVHHLHEVEHLAPALLVEAVLQRIARRSGSRCSSSAPASSSEVLGRVARQRRQELVAGQLADPILLVRHRLAGRSP